MIAARTVAMARLLTYGKIKYAPPAAKKVILMIVFRPTMSDRYPIVIRLKALMILKAVKMATADCRVNPLDSPNMVDMGTIEVPAAPCNAHVIQRNQKLLVRMLSPAV
jgi:hypothetical protein